MKLDNDSTGDVAITRTAAILPHLLELYPVEQLTYQSKLVNATTKAGNYSDINCCCSGNFNIINN